MLQTVSALKTDLEQKCNRLSILDQDNQDAISERDFICPPKRRRQQVEQPKLDFIPTTSLFSQLLNPPACSESGLFDNYFMKQNDLR